MPNALLFAFVIYLGIVVTIYVNTYLFRDNTFYQKCTSVYAYLTNQNFSK